MNPDTSRTQLLILRALFRFAENGVVPDFDEVFGKKHEPRTHADFFPGLVVGERPRTGGEAA